MKFKKPCAYPGCTSLITYGPYCEKHKPKASNAPNEWRYLYGDRWRKESRLFLLRHEACAICENASASEVDHIIPHRGDKALFWDRANWQGLCKHCHSVKTNEEIRQKRQSPALKKFK